MNSEVFTVAALLTTFVVCENVLARKFEDPARCSVTIKSYSAYWPCPKPIDGFVDLNGVRVWEAGWCHPIKPNKRGVTIITVDPVSCTAIDSYTFDTWLDKEAAADMATYLQWIPSESVVVGVTGDEPSLYLAAALRLLRVAGVHVGDVQFRGNFAFVLQKGYPRKTQLVKSVTNLVPFSLMTVNIQGQSARELKIIAVSKYNEDELNV